MDIHSHSLESALRALPPLDGQDDWPELRDRLSRRRSLRSRLRRALPTLRWVAACLAVLFGFGLYQALQGRRAVVADGGGDLRTWVAAHQDASRSGEIVDPWTESVPESAP